MFEFDNIESSEDTLNIIPQSPTSIDVVTPNSELLDGQITPFEVSDDGFSTNYRGYSYNYNCISWKLRCF